MTGSLFPDTSLNGASIRIGASFSLCRTWRYHLWRTWSAGSKRCAFVMLNPSTATETIDDPTIRRCVGYAKTWGHDGVDIVNLFACRSTDPKAIPTFADPVGPLNDETILHVAKAASVVVCGWGIHGAIANRGERVLDAMRVAGVAPYVLSLTKDGHPGHPLYLRKDLLPVAFDVARAAKGSP